VQNNLFDSKNLSVLRVGSFGGTYFRPIYSSVTDKNYTSDSVIQEYPPSWFQGIDIDTIKNLLSPRKVKLCQYEY